LEELKNMRPLSTMLVMITNASSFLNSTASLIQSKWCVSHCVLDLPFLCRLISSSSSSMRSFSLLYKSSSRVSVENSWFWAKGRLIDESKSQGSSIRVWLLNTISHSDSIS
jgi:hypothetical protein